MQEHISSATKGPNFHISILRKIKPFLPPDDFKSAVQALVISRLDYGCATLCGLPRYKLALLRASLNSAARLIVGSRRNSHITPVLKSLNWLPLEAKIDLKIACMTHKALHFITSLYLAQKLELSGRSRSSRSSSTLLLKPQKFQKKKTSNRAFSGIAPRIWNSLPPHIRLIPSSASFQKEVKALWMNALV